MKKVLFVATVDSHILAFHIPYLKYFKEIGYEVSVATNSDETIPYCDKKIKLPIERMPFKFGNIKAIRVLKKIILDEKYDVIHCHTPMGGVIARIAAKNARKKYNTKVIYTAHGFHFFEGAPLFNWLVYYPIEKFLSKYTDGLVTINQEDYNRAKDKFKAKKTYFVNGVGVEEQRFLSDINDNERQKIRKELKLKHEDFVLICVGELNKNKNQILAIETVKELVEKNKNIKLLLVGEGKLKTFYQEKIKEYGLENNVYLLGYRNDIPELLKISNLQLSLSYREGLPVNIIEGLISEIPIITTDCRGSRDLVKDGENGHIIPLNDKEKLKENILRIYNNYDNEKLKIDSCSCVIQKYFLKNVISDMKNIYCEILKKNVVHLLASNQYSGAENVAITIINKMKEKYDIVGIYSSPEGAIRNKVEEENINFEPLKKINISEIKRICKKYNPDVIHCHDFKMSVLVAFSNIKVKKVSHLHHNADWIKKINLKSLLYLVSSIKYEKILLVSNAILKEYIFSDFIKNKVEILGNPIDSEIIIKKSKEDIWDNKKIDVIFVGRLEKEKDPIRFIEIISNINKNINVNAAIIGDGTLRMKCETRIKELNLSNNIKLYGFMENPYNVIANAKIMCVTSKWEGFGLVAVEALILEIPVIANNVGGLPDIVDENCGKICEEDEEFCDEIIKLIKNPNYYNIKSKNAVIKSNKFSNCNNYMEMLYKIYII